MNSILLTGANGFIGRALCARLESEKVRVCRALRNDQITYPLPTAIKTLTINSIGPDTDWGQVLAGVDTVIHLAGRAHVVKERDSDPLSAYRRVNVAGTERLARMAVSHGVKRLVFLSSVKVNGEETETRYMEKDIPAPADPYAISKFEAEEVLKQIAGETGLEVVIIRPPLVYGPGVKANFLQLISIVAMGFPLPFKAVNNVRSLIYIGNLVDAIVLCAKHPLAAGQTYLVRDGEDVSTPVLIYSISKALGKPARLFPFSLSLMRLAGEFFGKSTVVNRLIGSLSVDDSKIRKELTWTPPFTMAEGLNDTVAWYKSGKS